MLRLLISSALFILLAIGLAAQTTHYQNGYIFDGERFAARDFAVVDGLLTFTLSSPADSTVDLAGGYVVPPFCETHNHGIDADFGLDYKVNAHLEKGIFYYKNPNSIPLLTDKIKGKLNHPESLDVAFANGGWTVPGGHPHALYDRLWKMGMSFNFPGQQQAEVMPGQAYWPVTTTAEIDAKWPDYLAQQPDFVKIYLLNSDEFDKTLNDTTVDYKGLSPELARHLTAKAHAAGLRVSTHVETAADFLNALRCDVDEINHLPGYGAVRDESRYSITPAMAQEAADSAVTVVATYNLVETFQQFQPDSVVRQRTLDVQRRNLQTLQEAGILTAIGSDNYLGSAQDELFHLHELDVYSPAELLRAYTEVSAAAIFPGRKIGRIAEGYEGSFLVLSSNPLEDVEALRAPVRWVKAR